MKVRIDLANVHIEDEIPSPAEVIDAFGSPRELPLKKVKRLLNLFKSYPQRKTTVQVDGRLDVYVSKGTGQ